MVSHKNRTTTLEESGFIRNKLTSKDLLNKTCSRIFSKKYLISAGNIDKKNGDLEIRNGRRTVQNEEAYAPLNKSWLTQIG